MSTRRTRSLEQQLQQQNTQLTQLQEEKKRLLAILFRVRERDAQQSKFVKNVEKIVSTETDKQKEITKLEQRLATVKSNWIHGMNGLSSEIKTLKEENKKLKESLYKLQTIQTTGKSRPIGPIPPQSDEKETTKPTFRYRRKRARRIARLRGR